MTVSENARYVVGIDLGTTNTVISYIDTHVDPEQQQVEVLKIPQTISPSVVEAKDSLPSFLYLAAGPEFTEGGLDLPWAQGRDYTVGWLAREQGSKVPKRVVGSSKSWLCHAGVDRNSEILPWKAPEEVPKLSPVEAARRYIEHLKDAWNHAMAQGDDSARLEQQDVLLTVPASFDAVARELTLQAAQHSGLSVTLLEEPQAAFYSWLEHLTEKWRDKLEVGDMVLVCDVGGGTTDFTLITVRDQDGDLVLERVAVGDHILLGGDNMDLALALSVSADLAENGTKLDAWQTRSLWHACRQAKEDLLGNDELESAPVTVLGRGSKVIGGTIKAELTREDLQSVLLDGFFPQCESSDRPKTARRGGLQELGLPYAADAGVTRHLAKFLAAHSKDDQQLLPTAILFNGGVMKADPLRQRTVDVINSWLAAAERGTVKELGGTSYDLAVSRGAAYYGMVRRGSGIRIRGGVARTYYIGIESALPAVPGMEAPLKALCVVPFGMEEGTEATIDGQEFGMVVGEPVEFRFLSSTTRKEDPIGEMLESWGEEEIEELVPIHTALEGETEEPGAPIPVQLHTRVTELGTLDLELRARDGRSWKLEYDVRESSDE
jgi:hypothetical protein